MISMARWTFRKQRMQKKNITMNIDIAACGMRKKRDDDGKVEAYQKNLKTRRSKKERKV